MASLHQSCCTETGPLGFLMYAAEPRLHRSTPFRHTAALGHTIPTPPSLQPQLTSAYAHVHTHTNTCAHTFSSLARNVLQEAQLHPQLRESPLPQMPWSPHPTSCSSAAATKPMLPGSRGPEPETCPQTRCKRGWGKSSHPWANPCPEGTATHHLVLEQPLHPPCLEWDPPVSTVSPLIPSPSKEGAPRAQASLLHRLCSCPEDGIFARKQKPLITSRCPRKSFCCLSLSHDVLQCHEALQMDALERVNLSPTTANAVPGAVVLPES